MVVAEAVASVVVIAVYGSSAGGTDCQDGRWVEVAGTWVS